MAYERAVEALRAGLLSFPITDYDIDGNFDPKGYSERLEWLMPYGASALFSAGGTGEVFSLSVSEHADVVRRAVETCGDHTPIIGSAAYGTEIAKEMAQASEKAGAAAILLMPHYLSEASQEGIAAHVEAVCKSVSIGVIVYNRGVCRLNADSLASIAERCPNLIGVKDGLGDIELMVSIRRKLGDRMVYLGGLPTAEVFAEAYKAIGVPVYSSAVFNFIPGTAMKFYNAVASNDSAVTAELLERFFLPFIAIRNRKGGYAVSLIKAGARLVGKSAGAVRTPLTEITASEEGELRELIGALGPQ
jgi:5-dehydro-4-deoxyglucarate dehydratase